jgi:hypothetical protein
VSLAGVFFDDDEMTTIDHDDAALLSLPTPLDSVAGMRLVAVAGTVPALADNVAGITGDLTRHAAAAAAACCRRHSSFVVLLMTLILGGILVPAHSHTQSNAHTLTNMRTRTTLTRTHTHPK